MLYFRVFFSGKANKTVQSCNFYFYHIYFMHLVIPASFLVLFQCVIHFKAWDKVKRRFFYTVMIAKECGLFPFTITFPLLFVISRWNRANCKWNGKKIKWTKRSPAHYAPHKCLSVTPFIINAFLYLCSIVHYTAYFNIMTSIITGKT